MAENLTPDAIRRAEFRTALRGADASQVRSYLEEVAVRLETLIQEKERLEARLGDFATRDLASEFDQIGREVSSILEAAREAAESMRERASLDAARWRSESMVDAEKLRKEAKNDAEALRGDAWAAGSELLGQAVAETKRIRQEAERDTLTITGEAEREAHRLVSAARRESEDLVRSATMDAEKVTSEATKRRDELIEQAHRQAAAAEERTRALEERREELLVELENARSTLSRLEGSLDERREDLDLSKSETSSVRVVPGTPPRDIENWELGETVRVVIPELPPTPPMVVVRRPEAKPPQPAAEQQPSSASPEPEASAVASEPAAKSVEPGKVDSASESAPDSDDVETLFASLRSADGAVEPRPRVKTARSEHRPPGAPRPSPPSKMVAVEDWAEKREARLLPAANRALRGVKKAVTDAQNVALDSLRTDSEWLPDQTMLADGMRADLIGLWAEAYSAGHTAAEEMLGLKLKRPNTPSSDAADAYGEALAEAISEALIDAGDGQRERQSATSRIFRSWRTDEAERRIRELAHRGYHRGMVESARKAAVTWVSDGTLCSACEDAATDPRNSLPPLHSGCECSVVVS